MHYVPMTPVIIAAYTSVFATGLASMLQTRDEMRYGPDVIMRRPIPEKPSVIGKI